ncbi:MAG: endonuclease/exonuclease/phosphatase family protein [Bdellovibrionales bacterium]|nr:endonuclease/exonuclease/phosphatase family protein [Bdellovibrionales bacterium]
MRLRVLTYNMHKGFCFYSRQYVLAELRTAIRSVNADVVFLQEVMGVHPPDEGDHDLPSQFEYLADEIWTHFAYGKNAIYSEGHHGNAILSKHPFLDYENINVSTNPLERRGLLHAQIQVNGTDLPVHLLCLHLDLLERGRRQQMQSLISRVQERVPSECPLIVAGDFNDWKQKFSDPMSDSLGLRESGVEFTGQHAKTFPSWRPFLALDRVYIRRFRVHDYQVLYDVPWRKMSDHAAVVTELEITQ